MPKSLPEAVQRQIEQTEQMDAEIASALTPPATDPDPPPAEPPAPEPPPVATDADNWQHKFLTLQGKYNSETAQLRGEVATLSQRVEELLQAQKTATTPPAPAPAPAAKLVTDADIETFGAELVDLVRRAAREEAGPERDRLIAEIQELKGQTADVVKDVKQVTEAVGDERRATYFAELAKEVPDYEAVNVDKAFAGWLTLTDPLSGLVRDDILQRAWGTFDHKRTAAIFNAFKAETGLKPAEPPPGEPAPKGLEEQVSPAGSKAAAEFTPDDGKKIWTSAEVQEFYTACTRGDFRGREAERARLDADIDKALVEGRVRA